MDGLNIYHEKDMVSVNDPVPDLSDVKVMGWNMIVQPIKVREETEEGLVFADKTIDDMKYVHNVGRVLALGDECYTDKTNFTKTDDEGNAIPWVEVGDFILYGRNRGERVYIKGHQLVLLADSLPLLKIGNPRDVDPFYNLTNG